VLKTVPEKATFLQSLHPRDRLRLLGMVEFLCCCIQVSQELLHSHVQQLFGVTSTDSGTIYIETHAAPHSTTIPDIPVYQHLVLTVT